MYTDAYNAILFVYHGTFAVRKYIPAALQDGDAAGKLRRVISLECISRCVCCHLSLNTSCSDLYRPFCHLSPPPSSSVVLFLTSIACTMVDSTSGLGMCPCRGNHSRSDRGQRARINFRCFFTTSPSLPPCFHTPLPISASTLSQSATLESSPQCQYLPSTT